PITFDHLDYSRSIRNAGWTALILDPIIDELLFIQVLMDGGSNLNLLYPDTIRKLGIDRTKIRHSHTSFKGVAPGPCAKCTGSLLLEVVFGSPGNVRPKKLIFHVTPFRSSHQALLGREAFVRFNAIPHYASLTLKMPGPRSIISLKGRSRPQTRLDESGINKLGRQGKEKKGGLIHALAVNPPDFIHLVHNRCDNGFELFEISARRQLLEDAGAIAMGKGILLTFALECGKLLTLPFHLTFPPGQLLGGVPLLLFGFSLFKDERLLRLDELRPLLINGPEGLLVKVLELLRMLLYVDSRPPAEASTSPSKDSPLIGALELDA
ncbi:uncharacterized protein LOC119292752, partial [Triticum dicoccoides]|uniref:uncharacterized protein LOC119292752 n=1 Tax=Triticum dicoccoides TaxID=85692 RepID=UPI00188E79E3